MIEAQENLNVRNSVQLDSVQKTVDEKLTTWSSVVAKNSEKKITQREVQNAVKLAIKEQDRERNVIMVSWRSRLCRELDFRNQTDTLIANESVLQIVLEADL
jgi:hypothetical protein